MATNSSNNTLARQIAEYRPRLRSYIRSYVADRDDADDILQEVMLQLVRTAERAMNPIENLSAWLYRVALNRIINFRTKKREEAMPSRPPENGGEDVMTEHLRSMVWQELEHALGELPDEQRAIFEMTELEGIPVKDIAEASGVPVATLNSRKHYAVLYLRKRLKRLYDELIYD